MELADNMQTLYKILLENHPDNEQIQKELGKLTNNKDTYLRQIIDLWDKRTQAKTPTPKHPTQNTHPKTPTPKHPPQNTHTKTHTPKHPTKTQTDTHTPSQHPPH